MDVSVWGSASAITDSVRENSGPSMGVGGGSSIRYSNPGSKNARIRINAWSASPLIANTQKYVGMDVLFQPSARHFASRCEKVYGLLRNRVEHVQQIVPRVDNLQDSVG